MDDPNQEVRITYRVPGTKPPIFIAGSFTSPPWKPQELQYLKKVTGSDETAHEDAEDADLEFFGDYKVGEGQYQYKFRIGHGDWWVCDESVETATDVAGNRNNVLTVQPKPEPPTSQPTDTTEEKVEPEISDAALKNFTPEDVNSALSPSLSPREEFAPLFAHESSELSKAETNDDISRRKSETSTPQISQLAGRVAHATLEPFPVETEKILQHIETTKSRIKEDETTVKDSPSSPIVNSKHGLATPPSSNDISPALQSISEEDMVELPKAMTTEIGDPVESKPGTASNSVPQGDGAQEPTVEDEASVGDSTSSELVGKDTPDLSKPSTNQGVKDSHGNFFQSFLRLVFVDILGGLFESFCGRRRHEQILIASTMVLVPAAALYWRAQQ